MAVGRGNRRALKGKRLFLFDLDGVFYKGKENRVRIGGTRAVEAIRRAGKSLFVLTNNSTDSVDTIHTRLAEFGIPVEKKEILTSGLLTAEYLLSNHGRVTYFLIGEDGLDEELRRLGHRRTHGERANFVVVGLDRGLTYEKLDHASRLARNGASIIATHSARLYMYMDGPAVATGPILKALEYATRKRAVVIGKPSPRMFRMALARAGCERKDAVMVGDQVETDLAGAMRAGIDAVFVTTGLDAGPARMKVLATLGNVDDLESLL